MRFVTTHTVGTNQGLTAFRIRASTVYSGTLYTDGHGQALVAASTPGAVKHYIQPGLDLPLPPGQWWQNGQTSIYERKPLAQQADWEYRRNPFETGAN